MGSVNGFRVADPPKRGDVPDFFRTYVELVLGKVREAGFTCAGIDWTRDRARLRFSGDHGVQVYVSVRGMGDGFVSDDGRPHLPSVRYSYDAWLGNRMVAASVESAALSPDVFDSRMRSALDLVGTIVGGFDRSDAPDMGRYLDRLELFGVVPWFSGDGDPGVQVPDAGAAVSGAVGTSPVGQEGNPE